MNITNITDDYDNITEYDNTTDTNNCNIDIIIPALLFTIPCCLSFFCLKSLMVYTLIKPLFNKKKCLPLYLSDINGENFIPKSSR